MPEKGIYSIFLFIAVGVMLPSLIAAKCCCQHNSTVSLPSTAEADGNDFIFADNLS